MNDVNTSNIKIKRVAVPFPFWGQHRSPQKLTNTTLPFSTKLRQEMRPHSASIVHLPFGISLYAASSGQVDASAFERSFHRTATGNWRMWKPLKGWFQFMFLICFGLWAMGAVHPGDQRMSKHFRRSFPLGRLKTNGFELNALGCSRVF